MNDRALLIGRTLIAKAREQEFIDDTEFLMIEALADVEKKFFMDLMIKTDEYLYRNNKQDLSLDEISGIFTFVFAKSAEAVTNYLNKSEQKFEFWGIFDGKVPLSLSAASSSRSRLMRATSAAKSSPNAAAAATAPIMA